MCHPVTVPLAFKLGPAAPAMILVALTRIMPQCQGGQWIRRARARRPNRCGPPAPCVMPPAPTLLMSGSESAEWVAWVGSSAAASPKRRQPWRNPSLRRRHSVRPLGAALRQRCWGGRLQSADDTTRARLARSRRGGGGGAQSAQVACCAERSEDVLGTRSSVSRCAGCVQELGWCELAGYTKWIPFNDSIMARRPLENSPFAPAAGGNEPGH